MRNYFFEFFKEALNPLIIQKYVKFTFLTFKGVECLMENFPNKMKALIVLNKTCYFINRICSFLSILLVGALVFLISIEVFFRYIVQNALSWPEELAGFCFVWVTMLGAAICLYKKSHIGVTVLTDKFPDKLKGFFKVFIYLLIISFSYLMFTKGYLLLRIVANQCSPAAQLNMSWEYSAIPATGMIFILYSIVSILNYFFTADDTLRGEL